jgi:hypothetical protein
MKTEIVSTSAIAIANLSIGEVTDHLKQVCGDYATFASKGCKYIGLLRGQLVASGENPEDVFGLVKTALMKGGMEEKQAKSTTNNGKPHQDLAEFTLKGEGEALKESHFYGISVENARRVVPFLRKGGDEAIAALNKLKLDKSGKLSTKAIDKLIPPPAKAEGNGGSGDGDGDGDGNGEGGGGSKKSAVDRALLMLTDIQSLMKEMTEDEADAVRMAAVEFIMG